MMKNINKIHEEAFILLRDWSGDKRTNTINNILDIQHNPYFYMRSVRDERFRKGYWFPGNDLYLCISFWAGGDSINKTPNIYFEINEKYGCRIVITAKDSEVKFNYFSKLVKTLNEEEILFNKLKSNLWIKQLSSSIENWKGDLHQFLIYEKIKIDKFVFDHEFYDAEEFISGFGLIDPSDFDKMLTRVLKERDLIEESQKRIEKKFIDTANFLPVSLSAITIENFQGVHTTTLSEIPSNARWIFITGENGYGKTTILQAIALGLSLDNILDDYLTATSRIETEVWLEGEKTFNSRNRSNYIGAKLPVIGYGPSRLNIHSKSSENDDFKNTNPIISLFDNETLLKNINYELFASSYADSGVYSDLENIIKTVTSGRIDSIKVDKREVVFFEKLGNGDLLPPLPLSKLAAGFRSIINIVIDIYLRLRDYHGIQISYADFYGIVLIDEIENHLHPILQRELPITLTKVFPKIQFIATTHSPIPLLAAEKNSVIITINRNQKDGVTIERLDEKINFPTLLPNAILTSPIFGFTNILPENKENSDFIRTEETYQEIAKNDSQKSLIDTHLSKEATEEILKLLKKD